MISALTPPPRPRTSVDDARNALEASWGLMGALTELGSQQDRNFLVEDRRGRYVLKVANEATTYAELDAQHVVLQRLADAGLRVPAPVPASDGRAIVSLSIGGQRLLARVLTFVEGTPLLDRESFGAAESRLLGTTAGRVAGALEGFGHPGTERRSSQWDVRFASDVVAALAESVPSLERRAQVQDAAAGASARMQCIGGELPMQVIHADITDDNVVLDGNGGVGVIDFGDLMLAWRVGELVATAASSYMRPDPDRLFLETVAAFAEQVSLTDAELAALWPLTILRTAVLVVSGEHQVAIDGDNEYADVRRAAEWHAFSQIVERDPDEMEMLVRATARGAAVPRDFTAGLLVSSAVEIVDLSVLSEEYEAGNWLDAGAESRILHRRAALSGTAVTRWGEYRLTRTRPLAPRGTAATFAVGVQMTVAEDTPLTAPFAGVRRAVDGGWVVESDGIALWLLGPVVQPTADLRDSAVMTNHDGGLVSRGATIGILPAGETATIQLATVPGIRPPLCVGPGLADRWSVICPDPSSLFGLHGQARRATPAETLVRRNAVYASAQEHYYRDPPQMERGWREFLIDAEAQTYVDAINNVTIVGHAHPTVVRAAARQWSLLNTNSRFHYAAVAELSERLVALAPERLTRVFLVNSGSEAVDLALRLARTATARDRILAAREAYHGWTLGADAVSTSIGDNPRSLTTRPEWVELIDAPNPLRGKHRGRDSAPAYLADLDHRLEELGAVGRADIAGVILEPIFGNGGGVLLPDGFLAGVYERVRSLGGVCISDEVQVGYGRLGEHFWGFEQQGAAPDVICIAKAMGNGQPLGAVITTAAIAEAFEQEGSFFSSAGGSPVSSRVGVAVLDALHADGLQTNARDVGRNFRDGLQDLAVRHSSIGAVHGMGLYLGVELVADDSLTPDPALADRVCELLLDEGCIVQPTGDHKNVLKIKPPLCISPESVDYVIQALDRCLEEATA